MKWAGVTFACSHCGAVFAGPDALRAHALRHTSTAESVPQRASAAGHAGAVESARGQACMTFACTRCGDAFRTADELRTHIVRHRLTMGDAPASATEEARRALELDAAASAGDEVLPASSPSLRASRRGARAAVPGIDTARRSAPRREAGTGRRGFRLERREARRVRRRRDRSRAFALLAATVLLLLLSSRPPWSTTSARGPREASGRRGRPRRVPAAQREPAEWSDEQGRRWESSAGPVRLGVRVGWSGALVRNGGRRSPAPGLGQRP